MDIAHATQELSRLPTHRFHQFATSVTETGQSSFRKVTLRDS